jgi:hypothetical protein
MVRIARTALTRGQIDTQMHDHFEGTDESTCTCMCGMREGRAWLDLGWGEDAQTTSYNFLITK